MIWARVEDDTREGVRVGGVVTRARNVVEALDFLMT